MNESNVSATGLLYPESAQLDIWRTFEQQQFATFAFHRYNKNGRSRQLDGTVVGDYSNIRFYYTFRWRKSYHQLMR